MEKEKMINLGGILILLSVFLPALFVSAKIRQVQLEVHWWLFGLMYGAGTYKGETRTTFLFLPTLTGLIYTAALVVIAIIIILSANQDKVRKVKILGIVAIGIMLWVFVINLMGFILSNVNFMLLPHIGFLVLILGSVLVIRGAKS